MTLDFSFVNPEFLRAWVLHGLIFSLVLTGVALVGGLVLGTLLALMRLSGRPWLAKPAAGYVNLMRSVPLVMVILWFFLLIPNQLYRVIAGDWGAAHAPEVSAFITFTLFEAAYFAEIMRAGIQSVPQAQQHAGFALGMTYRQTMGLVVLPQAFRNMLPVLLTQTIVLFQDTSLVYAIGAYDLLKGFESAGRNYNRPVETYLMAALVYFVICFSLSLAVRKLQSRVAILR